jgi:hypothetical protein
MNQRFAVVQFSHFGDMRYNIEEIFYGSNGCVEEVHRAGNEDYRMIVYKGVEECSFEANLGHSKGVEITVQTAIPCDLEC